MKYVVTYPKPDGSLMVFWGTIGNKKSLTTFTNVHTWATKMTLNKAVRCAQICDGSYHIIKGKRVRMYPDTTIMSYKDFKEKINNEAES